MTGYVADLSWKSGARAIEKLDRLRSIMAVNVLRVHGLKRELYVKETEKGVVFFVHVFIIRALSASISRH